MNVQAFGPNYFVNASFLKLTIQNCTDALGILTFYMGKNTPERKDSIMGNLVVAVEA